MFPIFKKCKMQHKTPAPTSFNPKSQYGLIDPNDKV